MLPTFQFADGSMVVKRVQIGVKGFPHALRGKQVSRGRSRGFMGVKRGQIRLKSEGK